MGGMHKMTEFEKQVLRQINKKQKKSIFQLFTNKYKALTADLCVQVQELQLHNIVIDSFEILRPFSNLKSIYFYGCEFTKECMEEEILLEQIEEVDFENVPMDDLNILQYFPNVSKLAFWDYGAKQKISMNGIENATRLRRFYSVNTVFTQLEQIAVCDKLMWLELDNYLPAVDKVMIADYSFVNALTELRHLGLMTGTIEDVSFLKHNKNLNELNLSQNTKLRGIEKLTELKKLQKLDLDDCKIPYSEKKKYIKMFSHIENFSIEN